MGEEEEKAPRGWIVSWTEGIWGALGKWGGFIWGGVWGRMPGALRVDVAEALKRAGVSSSPADSSVEVIGWLMSIKERFAITQESDLQKLRLKELSYADAYPPNVDSLGSLAVYSVEHLKALAAVAGYTGKRGQYAWWLYEMARRCPDVGTAFEMYRRGIIDDATLETYLKEGGYVDRVVVPTVSGDKSRIEWKPVKRPDRERMKQVAWRVPDLADIITMELRDTFPRTSEETLRDDPELAGDPSWQKFKAAGGGRRPQIYDWEPGGGKDITDAMSEGREYGPQSFASYFLGGRRAYTGTFEKIAQSKGLPPPWAMKYWEAHWKLPDIGVAREMLFRTPQVTPQMFRTMLRWQDYPPGLLDSITQIAYEPLPRVDVRRMHLRGVLSIPELFECYLYLGYAPQNAARMTAFTVIWNADRRYAKAIKGVRSAYVGGVIDLEEAQKMMLEIYAPPTAADIPDITDLPLTDEQKAAVVETYVEIATQTAAWVATDLRAAEYERTYDLMDSRADTAKQMYTSWRWSDSETVTYLNRAGLEGPRIESLMQEWEPARERHEHLPSMSMLEDFLRREDMSVEQWAGYMTKLGYSDVTVAAILKGQDRLPTRAMLERFLAQGVITAIAFRHYMALLGYSAGVSEQIIQTMTREGLFSA